MDRGYFKSWRKEIDSAIWRQPPHYYRFWKWLQSSVAHAGNAGPAGLQIGALQTTYPKIAHALRWGESNTQHSHATIRAMLHWMSVEEIITYTLCPKGAVQGIIVNICNWNQYEADTDGLPVPPIVPVTQPPDEPQPDGDLFGVATSKPDKKKQSRKRPYVASAQAARCLQAWAKYRALPTDPEGERLTADDTYHKVFDQMHNLDKVPWDDLPGVPGIFSRCAWAVTDWTEDMIQSPSKMRHQSNQYKEKKVHEQMATQIRTRNKKPESEKVVYRFPDKQDWKDE